MTIGEQVWALRKRRGLRQTQLAERAGLHHTLISKLERDRRLTTSLKTLLCIANALEVTLSELVEGVDEA